MIDIAAVDAALSGLRIGYEADGYRLLVEGVSSDGVVQVRIAAGPNACQECLVPKSIASSTIKRSLRDLPIADVEVAYPTDA